jgi:hypothetical protein
MPIIQTEGNSNYWYEGEASSDVSILTEDIGTQEYWHAGEPAGFLSQSTIDEFKPFAFAVMIGF